MNHRRPRRQEDVGSFHKRRRNERRESERLRDVAVLTLASVAVVSFGMVAGILMRTVRTRSLSQELSAMHVQAAEQTAGGSFDVQGTYEDALPFDAIYGEGDMPQEGGASEQPAAAQPEGGDAQQEPDAQQAPLPTQEPAAQATPEPVTDLTGYAAEATATPAGEVVKTTAFHQYGGTALAEMETLYARNHDLVGWLTIDEVLDLPLVYRNNSYYLTHDFDGNKSASGTLFLDVNHPLREKTQNLLLHGHNMKDGTMFGRLTQYEQSIDYLKAHPFVELSTLWQKEHYVIFAVLVVSLDVKDERFFDYYSHPTFSSDRAFSSYIRELELRSMYAIPMDVQPSDALLTLSTCMGDDRLVIVCRRIRQNESRSSLRETIRLAARQ